MRTWLVWTLSFLSFPLAGILGGLVAGPVDSPPAALIGGLVTGAVIGSGQALAGRFAGLPLDPRRWIPATTVGMGVGLFAGGSLIGFGTSIGRLAVMGAVTGAFLGLAQALALPSPELPSPELPAAARVRRLAWGLAMPALWALGWTVTTAVGVDVERQYTVFGSTGAITVSALAGLLLLRLLPARSTAPAHPLSQIGDLA